MKITRLDLRNLRNEEWFQFFTEFKALVEKYNSETFNIFELFAAFVVLLENADEAIEKIRKSIESDLMIEADAARDRVFRGMADAVKSAINHFDSAKQRAALRLQIIFNTYGNLAARPYNEETAGIHNFLQEIRNSVNWEALQNLGLTEWVNELDTKNQAFEALVMNRNINIAGKTELKMIETRRELDKNYRSIVARIEAFITIGYEDNYRDFVRELNANIDRYDRLIAQRTGKTAAKTPKVTQ